MDHPRSVIAPSDIGNKWWATVARLDTTFASLVRPLRPIRRNGLLEIDKPPPWLETLMSSVCTLQGKMDDIKSDLRHALRSNRAHRVVIYHSEESILSALLAVHTELSLIETTFARERAARLPRAPKKAALARFDALIGIGAPTQAAVLGAALIHAPASPSAAVIPLKQECHDAAMPSNLVKPSEEASRHLDAFSELIVFLASLT